MSDTLSYREAAMMTNDGLFMDDFIDYIPERQKILRWGFDMTAIVRAFPGSCAVPVHQALVEGLADIARSGRERVRKRFFFVRVGEHDGCYWVAVPSCLPGAVIAHIAARLEALPGYAGRDTGWVPAIPLVPAFSYDRGVIVNYLHPWLAGTSHVVAHEGQVRGVLMEYRKWFPLEANDDERRYQMLLL